MSLGVEWLSPCIEFHLLPLVCINPKPLSLIIGNTDVDALSSHLPTSATIAPVLNEGLMSAGFELTATCEILLNIFDIKFILIFTHSNLTVNLNEGPVEGAVDILQQSSPTLTGSCLLRTFLSQF